MKWLNAICLALMTASVLYVAQSVGGFVADAKAKMDAGSPKIAKLLSSTDSALTDVHSIEIETQRTEFQMAGLLNATRHSMITAKQQQQLVENATMLLSNANAAVLSLKESSDKLGNVAPSVSAAIDKIQQDTHETMVASRQMIEATTSDLADPSIKQALASVADTSKEVDASAQDVHQFIHRETSPVRGAWNTIKGILKTFGPTAVTLAK